MMAVVNDIQAHQQLSAHRLPLSEAKPLEEELFALNASQLHFLHKPRNDS
jgi:hypothetical protein